MFSQYFHGSTEVLQRKYYSTFKEVLQSSLESTANRQAIVYQSRPTQPINSSHIKTHSPPLFSEKGTGYSFPKDITNLIVNINYAHLAVECNLPSVREFHFIFIAFALYLDDGSVRVIILYIRADGRRNNLSRYA